MDVNLLDGDLGRVELGGHRITINFCLNAPGAAGDPAVDPVPASADAERRYVVEGRIGLDLGDLTLIEPAWDSRLAGQAEEVAWQLLDAERRSEQENVTLLSAAYTARLAWSLAGEVRRVAITDWMLARAYMALQALPLALAAAERCHLATVRVEADGGYARALGYEGMARALAASGDKEQALRYLRQAEQAQLDIHGADERQKFGAQLAADPWFGLR